jgi:hypothetical protein
MSDNNDHRVLHNWGTTTYWKDGSACGCFDQWTDCEVQISGTLVSFWKFGRSDSFLLDRILSSLEQAFRLGQKSRSKEIMHLLSR